MKIVSLSIFLLQTATNSGDALKQVAPFFASIRGLSAATDRRSSNQNMVPVVPAPLKITASPDHHDGRRRRNVPKIPIPLNVISAIVASMKTNNVLEAIQIFARVIKQNHGVNKALPISYKSLEELSFVTDCVSVQQAKLEAAPFLKELTPKALGLDARNNDAQVEYLQQHADSIKQMKLSHGAVLFQQWSLFETQEGVSSAYQALDMTPCRDPKEIRAPAELLSGSSTIYETLNNPDDAATYLGLHNEGIPGIMPSSALFSCFRAADHGGEFLVADARRIFRDMDSETLAHLEERKLRPTFADIPDWMSTPPWPLCKVPGATSLYRELLALVTDLTKPTDDFFLDVFPSNNNETCLKLTTHAATPVIYHPTTHTPVWFSGIDSGHRELFIERNPQLYTSNGKYASEVFDVRYGDGSPVSKEDLTHILEACSKNTVSLKMQPGDAVLLDNFCVMHGRLPFEGKRQHAVVWFMD